jgi:GxxExxY protein
MSKLLYRDEVYAIIGAAMEVHNVLGCGFLEPVYQKALEIELTMRQIPYLAQHQLTIDYKGRTLDKHYVADFISYDKIIIEIKAVNHLSTLEESQLLNYLKPANLRLVY